MWSSAGAALVMCLLGWGASPVRAFTSTESWFTGAGALAATGESSAAAPTFTSGTDQSWVVNGEGILGVTDNLSPQQKFDAMLAFVYCDLYTSQRFNGSYGETIDNDALGWFNEYIQCLSSKAGFPLTQLHYVSGTIVQYGFTPSTAIDTVFQSLLNQSQAQGSNVDFTNAMYDVATTAVKSLNDNNANSNSRAVFNDAYSTGINSTVILNVCDAFDDGGVSTTQCTNSIFLLETLDDYTIKILWITVHVDSETSWTYEWAQNIQDNYLWDPENTDLRQYLLAAVLSYYDRILPIILDD